MEDKSRQWGIDLARIIATYGIVLIHSGDYAPYSGLAMKAQDFFGFSLPFFLAASFYLLANPEKKSTSSKLISSRYNRLLLPYLVWSLVYLIARIIKESIANKSLAFGNLFQDPLAILFYGSSAVHLYFLPLLFTGNLFAIAIKKYKTNLNTSVILFLVSLTVYNLILQFSNNFSMGFVKAHAVFYALQMSDIHPVLKFALIQSWFIVICLPYIFFARTIYEWINKHSSHRPISTRNYLLLVLTFVITITFGRTFYPLFLNEPIFGCLLLILAINFPYLSLSNHVQNILLDLSKASFGIYLIHHLIINFSETLVFKIKPSFMSQVSLTSQILFSASGFLASWWIVRLFTNRERANP